jgi:excinuclease ABC subunit C
MAQKNAGIQLARLLAEEGSQQARTRALVEALDLEPDTWTPSASSASTSRTRRAKATQASCVVFHHHQMQNREYRRYNIDDITPGDDYAAMRQVLTRRYAKLAQAGRDTPEATPAEEPLAEPLPEPVPQSAVEAAVPLAAAEEGAPPPNAKRRSPVAEAARSACPTWCWWTAAAAR